MSGPLANHMEDKHCAGKTLYSVINEVRVWRAYLMSVHTQTKTLGSIFMLIDNAKHSYSYWTPRHAQT